MPKNKSKEVESKYGKDIGEILIELYEHYGEREAVANHLNISRSTLVYWLGVSGLREVKRVEYVFTPTEKAKELTNGR